MEIRNYRVRIVLFLITADYCRQVAIKHRAENLAKPLLCVRLLFLKNMRNLIKEIKPNEANFDYIKKQGKINGSLLIDIENVVKIVSIRFGVWLSVNCIPSFSKDGWYVFKGNWKTTDECFEIFIHSNESDA